MAKKKPAVVKPKAYRWICETNGSEEGLPDVAIITLTKPRVERILSYQRLLLQMRASAPNLMYLEIGESDADYFDSEPENIPFATKMDRVGYDIDLSTGKIFENSYTRLPDDYVPPESDVRTSYEHLVVSATDVYWLAALKHVDGEVETKQIPIADLKELLKEME